MRGGGQGRLWVTAAAIVMLLAFGATAKDYYIDPKKGDDGNSGAAGAPWRSFANVVSYYKSEYRPAGWVELKPGDCIYLKSGVYSELLNPGGWKQGRTGGGSFVAYFRGMRGKADRPFEIKAFAGDKPVIDARGKGIGLSIFQSGNWVVEGIEVRGAFGRGISLTESEKIRIRGVHVHDTDGVDNNNISGLYVTDCREVEVWQCTFNDNYDRTCADTGGRATENSTNVVIFGGMRGGDISIHDCLIYQSLPVSHALSGGGIKYKHASRAPGAYFRVYNNVFMNCKFFAFGSGTANTHFHHNLIVGGGGISSRDFGGVTHQVDQVFENNTLYCASGFVFNPTIRWRNKDFPDDPKHIVFRKNIVYDKSRRYSSERGIVCIGTYMSDELYDIVTGELTFGENCYYNPNGAVQLNIAAGFNYKQGYAKGGTYSFSQWKDQFGYDSTSIETDPLFADVDDRDFRLQAQSKCKGMGRYER